MRIPKCFVALISTFQLQKSQYKTTKHSTTVVLTDQV